MHGHQLRQLAELEHMDQWTDITVGALYGAIKRLAAEELIEEVRTEREGSYPERQVWRITLAGRKSLSTIRRAGLSDIVIKPDPFDLALARFDVEMVDQLPETVQARLSALRAMLVQVDAHTASIAKYLTPLELFVISHRSERIRAEIAWHEDLVQELPQLLTDEIAKSKKGHKS
jgi:DNA-binding PadR family transcriptional regulator